VLSWWNNDWCYYYWKDLTLYWKDLETISIDELQSSLLVQEQHMQWHIVAEQALKILMTTVLANQAVVEVPFEVGDKGVRDKILINHLLNVFIVMNLAIFSMNVQRKARKMSHKPITLKPLNHCCSWHILMLRIW
jgi:hypothetical protein